MSVYFIEQVLKFISHPLDKMPNKVRAGRGERTEQAFRKKGCLSHTAFGRRNG